ncbi:MAG: hypothetical protein WC824_15620, partial [Bacteroidota bacterium]
QTGASKIMLAITLARKPLGGTVAETALKWGTGGLNIDGCRISGPAWNRSTTTILDIRGGKYNSAGNAGYDLGVPQTMPLSGRWPANLLFQHSPECKCLNLCAGKCPVAELDRQSGVLQSGGKPGSIYGATPIFENRTFGHLHASHGTSPVISDSGGASRFFKQVGR